MKQHGYYFCLFVFFTILCSTIHQNQILFYWESRPDHDVIGILCVCQVAKRIDKRSKAAGVGEQVLGVEKYGCVGSIFTIEIETINALTRVTSREGWRPRFLNRRASGRINQSIDSTEFILDMGFP